ncbi:N-succinyl-L-Arg/Lys racemase [Thermogemmatispora aurantia]|uniref:mandelate racemase/muconate lactonizing enzyme family protein n=1 Tax=Thermogemmatispora TaxID=768669 RepID=UPI000853F031|nr:MULTISPECIES: enolase C-terminal domain-like protein [Thermogemmatispora]GER85423.1 N-succinyl-L-Arg/Lys racemase [Thermogemmatispora aurantia]
MKITGYRCYLVTLPSRRVHNWASKMETPIGSHLLLRLETDEGLIGWGEAPAIATWGGAHMTYFGETPRTVHHIIADYLFPVIVGHSPLEIGPLHAAMDRVVKGHPYAKAAVDMALYDLAGQALGVPVYQLLGGAYRDRLPIAHSLGIMENRQAVAEAERAVAEGARTIKAKTGLDPARDIELVRLLREALGPGIQIRVDANEGYRSVSEAVRVTRAMQSFDLAFTEQPVADVEALALIARQVAVPVMADESAWTPQDILRIHALQAAELISLYVTKPGGLFRAREVAAVAEAVGLRCDIGGSIEMGVGNAANLHLGAATRIAELASVCPVSRPAEALDGQIAGVYYLDDIISEPLAYEDGAVLVPQRPGLGVQVDERKLAKYAVAL